MRVSFGEVANPSEDTGWKSGPRLGSLVACATVLDEAAGGVLFEAHAESASDPIKNNPRCLMVVPFLLSPRVRHEPNVRLGRTKQSAISRPIRRRPCSEDFQGISARLSVAALSRLVQR